MIRIVIYDCVLLDLIGLTCRVGKLRARVSNRISLGLGVIERHSGTPGLTIPSLEPPVDTVEVESMVANTPSDGTIVCGDMVRG